MHEPGQRYYFPYAAAITLILVIALECSAWHYRDFFWNINYISLEQKRRALTDSSLPKDDVAILGGSRLNHIDPSGIREWIGAEARVSNYSWGWMGVEAYEAMLRGLISAGRVPRFVLVDNFPEFMVWPEPGLTFMGLDRYKTGFAETVPALAGIKTELSQHQWAGAWDLFLYNTTPPSLRYRQDIQNNLIAKWEAGEKPSLPKGYHELVENWAETGFYTPAPHIVNDQNAFNDLQKSFGEYKLRHNPEICAKYEHFLTLAREHNVTVIMIPIPTNPYAAKLMEQDGIYSAHDKWLDSLQHKFPNFSAPGPRYHAWPNVMLDGLHLNATGAKRHMELIISILKSQFPQSGQISA